MNCSHGIDYPRFALASDADRSRLIDAKHVVVAEWVRMKCRFGCDGYGAGHLCPPRTPPANEMRRMLENYSKGLLFTFENVRDNDRYRTEREHRELAF